MGPSSLLVVEVAVFTAINPTFISPENISNTLVFTVELGLIALAMTLLMTSGEFDLSVGSLFGFSPVLMWTLFNGGLASLEVSFVIALVVAALIGLVNGWFVTRLKIPSFLVTLGMLLVVRGAALFITSGFPQRTWSAQGQWLAEVLVGDFYLGRFRIYASLFWFVAAAIILGYVLTQTKVGNWILASGGNPGAARARGVNVDRTKVALFILCCHDGRAGRHHQLDPHIGRQSEQRHGLRARGDRDGRGRRHGARRWPRHHRGDGARHLHPARHAQRHRADRRAGPRLQHLHRRDHPRHDGAPFMARTPTSRGNLTAMTELIRMEHIDKFYGRVQALDDVTVRVNEREIVGLLGDNGAGKSTLIKVLSGAVPMTRGDIFIRGRKVNIRSTTDAIALGIETIYQDSALVTQLSIARNLFLGREPIKGPRFLNRMDKAAMNAVATDLLAEVGLSKNIPPMTPIGSLSGGERQAVAIARAMHFDSELIVLDEPTNNLGVAETQGVLRFVRNARELGPFLHLHRPQHPSRVPGGRSHHRPAPGQGGRRRHRPPAVQHRRGRAGDHRDGRTGRAEHRGVGPG